MMTVEDAVLIVLVSCVVAPLVGAAVLCFVRLAMDAWEQK